MNGEGGSRKEWYLVPTPGGSDADLRQLLAHERVASPPRPERRLDQDGQLIEPDATEFFQLSNL